MAAPSDGWLVVSAEVVGVTFSDGFLVITTEDAMTRLRQDICIAPCHEYSHR